MMDVSSREWPHFIPLPGLALLFALGACCACTQDQEVHSNNASSDDAGQRQALGASESEKIVYSFVDSNGHIRMAGSIAEIPEEYRSQVLATDTAGTRSNRLARDRLVVLDLRQRKNGESLNYSLVDLKKIASKVPRNTELRDVDSANPGELGRRAVRHGADQVRNWLGLKPELMEKGVLLYTASWCGFCKKAADYLRKRGVPFLERDIEANRAAAVELSSKLRKAGMQGAGIPVLDISGTLVIGFDKARIEKLLDEM